MPTYPPSAPAPGPAPSQAVPQSSTAPIPAPSVPLPPGASLLGVQHASMAGITVTDLLKNKSAINMLLHYHKKLEEENLTLKNDLNTANTYVAGYQIKKSKTTVGAILQAVAAIPLGVAINILTGDNKSIVNAGWVILLMGVGFQFLGLFYALWEEK